MKLFFRYLYGFVSVGIVLCIIAQMVISNQMIIYGNKLGQVNQRIDELQDQNNFLEKKLVEQQSVQRISTEAKRLGFVEPSTYLAFSSDSFPIAIKR